MNKRLVIGMSGATGSVYGSRMLEVLKDTDVETHLVISNATERTIQLETDYEEKTCLDGQRNPIPQRPPWPDAAGSRYGRHISASGSGIL